ncbi:MAG: aldehyde-activating protein [Geminicoccaceae bacterium]|nr:aldehyde-activating protein [Geminicoccaceae bacterium]
MPTTYRGGCLCGATRYEITAEPMFGGQCQCLDCQHETGGGHASFMAFPAEAVKLTGTPRFYESRADSGNVVRRGFCPTCGSSVVGLSSGMPEMTTVPAGSLDDPSVFKAGFVVYTSRGHAWDLVDPALPRFPQMPPMPGSDEHAARRA